MGKKEASFEGLIQYRVEVEVRKRARLLGSLTTREWCKTQVLGDSQIGNSLSSGDRARVRKG